MALAKLNCPNCNGEIKFNPKLQKAVCTSCRTKFIKNEYIKLKEQYDKIKTNEQELVEYVCPSCGSELISNDENDIMLSCPYCRNEHIIKEKIEGTYKPDFIIPFNTTKEETIEHIFKIVKKDKILPEEFRKITKQDIKIDGIYVPSWINDVSINGNYIFTIMVNMISKKAMYKCFRKIKIDYSNVPFDASKKFDDEIMINLEPYNYDKKKVFSPMYLTGYKAEKYDNELAQEKLIERIKYVTEDIVLGTIKPFHTVTQKDIGNPTVDITKSKYILLPIWKVQITLGNDTVDFYVNGESGKTIRIYPKSKNIKELPIKKSKTNIFISSVIIVVLLTIITIGMFYFMYINNLPDISIYYLFSGLIALIIIAIGVGSYLDNIAKRKKYKIVFNKNGEEDVKSNIISCTKHYISSKVHIDKNDTFYYSIEEKR